MRIGILTSSRADFGIYLPLLKHLKEDPFFDLKIIAFGTHLSTFHGETINQICSEGFEVTFKIESMLLTDSPEAISTAIGLTTIKFANFWDNYRKDFDLVLCLGDRYEMFAAVSAAIPFNIPFAHLHGGEVTLGAIDNIYRDAITLASTYHFVSTENYGHRVANLTRSSDNIFNVGALSLDNVESLSLLTIPEFRAKWGVDLSRKTILCTFHPETVSYESNAKYADELVNAIKELTKYQVLVTMPNADTAGNIIRAALTRNFSNSERVFLIENLGSKSYFSAMKHCSFLMGNTSSGIIEAASFKKFVINLGDRQKGRAAGINVLQTSVSVSDIIQAVTQVEHAGDLKQENMYWNGGAANKIVETFKSINQK